MGLFRRSDRTASELAELRAKLDELTTELSERAEHETSLEHRLDEGSERTDAELRELRAVLAAARAELASTDDLASLRSELSGTTAMVSAVRERLEPTVADLDARLQAMHDRLSTPLPDPPPDPPPTPSPQAGADPAELRALGTQLARLDERLAAVDRRVTVVSTELANQIAEISSEIDRLDEAATVSDAGDTTDAHAGDTTDDGAAIDPEIIDELRDAQLRLANEQARYQIAFRDDLARLAELLKRR